MGAPSAMQLCLRHPERCSALVLMFPIAFRPPAANEPPARPPSTFSRFRMNRTLKSDFLFWTASKLSRNKAIWTILATPPADFKKATPEEQQRVLHTVQNVLPISARQDGLRNEMAAGAVIPRYDLEHIATPTLV